jgi:hypothetical protein
MKKKWDLEADLDPAGTRHTRPGSRTAEAAIANARSATKRKKGRSASATTRPGATAAARAVEATKPKRRTGK